MLERTLERTYVWEIPVRFTHWVNVACIVILSITGYYIASPFVTTGGEAYNHFAMGTVRYIHFVTAFVFTASILLRTYWAFFGGNRFASWRALVPFLTPEGRGKVGETLRYYFFLQRKPPYVLGHNTLAGATYAVIVFLYLLQTLFGFALYGEANVGGIWWNLTSWVFTLMSNQTVRLWHHLIMYLLIAFAIHHVYSAFLMDTEEGNGLLSSIFTGFKFISRGK